MKWENLMKDPARLNPLESAGNSDLPGIATNRSSSIGRKTENGKMATRGVDLGPGSSEEAEPLHRPAFLTCSRLSLALLDLKFHTKSLHSLE
jgi:hypothetical protein